MFEEQEEESYLAKLGGSVELPEEAELPEEGEAPPPDAPRPSRIATSNAPPVEGVEPRLNLKQFCCLRLPEPHRDGFAAYCRGEEIANERKTVDQWEVDLKTYWQRPIR